MAMEQYNARPRPFDLEYGTDEKVVFNFFNAVYAWMCVGLAVTATVAWLVSQNKAVMGALYGRGIALAFLVGSVLMVMAIRPVAMKVGAGVATVLFLLYSGVVGMMLSGIFIRYAHADIFAAFIVTAGTFGAMSIYGFVTKRDLTSLGSFFFMALVGLLIATVVNIFWANSVLYWAITYIGLLIFVGLTAYDTQKLKQIAHDQNLSQDTLARLAIVGSLELYLDFINMFIYILRILGSRR